jgi:hypothetical protein
MLEHINKLSHISLLLHEMANKNLEQLNGKCLVAEESQDYYFGMLRRQAQLSYDLHAILKNRPSENLSTPYIIFRALLDDFLHVLYLEISKTPEEDIIRINAQSYRDNFVAIKNLTNSNIQQYSGDNLEYLSQEDINKIQAKIKSNERLAKYLVDGVEFKFKQFIPVTDIAKIATSSEHYEMARDRSFFLWKGFSSFVHYSNWSYEYELTHGVENFNQMEESLQYVFNTIYFCAYYFKRTKKIDIYADKFFLQSMGWPLLVHLK